MTKKERALQIIERLKEAYPDAGCTLEYDQAWKLLVSVRLAAQCTDARVNVVVEKLYEKYPDVAQKYRFERVELSSDVPAEAQKETSVQSEYEGGINPKVLEFLDSEDFDERYNILVALRDEIDDQIINTLAVALDVVIPEGDIDDRYDQLKMCLRTRQRYESNRLR